MSCGARTGLRGEPIGPDAGPPRTIDAHHHLALGMNHTCLVVAGTVRCWGQNRGGELGDGTTNASSVPVTVVGIDDAAFVASGIGFDVEGTRGSHTCVIRSDFSVWCWGENVEGNTDASLAHPTLVPARVDGVEGVVNLAVSGFENCAVLADGTAKCWGSDELGALGDGQADGAMRGPVAVKNLDDVREIDVGAAACALRGDGTVWCWGDAQSGALGNGGAIDGDVVAESSPVPVASLVTDAIHLGGSGGAPECALLSGGGVTCWGLVVGAEATRSTPAVVAGLANATSIAVAAAHACALLADGTVTCWGSNYDGGLGNGVYAADVFPPVPVTGLSNVVEIASGGWHTCALVADGSVWCWGQNGFGELGDGTLMNRDVPARVVGVP